MARFNVVVVWADGDEEFVAGPNGDVAVFTSRDRANEIAEGFRFGMDPQEIQSVNVVREAQEISGVEIKAEPSIDSEGRAIAGCLTADSLRVRTYGNALSATGEETSTHTR